MFSGMCAFPLTPLRDEGIDEPAFERLMARLVEARVDAICALGSTGSYAYLSRAERARVVRLAVELAGDIPVVVGIGAMRTRDVLDLAQDAQDAGARGVLLAPVSYQPLSEAEVYGLFEAVTRRLSVPLCVYDNPRTTRFTFSDALFGRVARLANVASIKIPAVSPDPVAARERIDRLRAALPETATIGISGDASAASGLAAGCDAWYSVLGGLFPQTALAILRAAQEGDPFQAARLSERLAPLWALFAEYGSLRVIAAAAELAGLVACPSLPLPLQAVDGAARERLAELLERLDLS